MGDGPIQHRTRYTHGRCRRCGAQELHRSHAQGLWENLVRRLTPLVAMRCPACGWRTVGRLSTTLPLEPSAAPAPPSRRHRPRRSRRAWRRWKKRLVFAAWVIGAGTAAVGLGYLASR